MLLLAWVLAVLIRLATGSATIATITASSLIIDLVAGMSTGEVSLVVLAIGAGSLFFSHVNDAGFWLVNQYFGMTVGQTDQDLVGDGDGAVGERSDRRAAAVAGHLGASGEVVDVAAARHQVDVVVERRCGATLAISRVNRSLSSASSPPLP